MSVSQEKVNKAIREFREHNGLLRYQEAKDAGIYERILYYLRDNGYIEQIDRGLFQLNEVVDKITNPDMVVVQKKFPDTRICLLSALQYHQLTIEIPHSVYVALPQGSRKPQLRYPSITVFRFSPETFEAGVEEHKLDGMEIKIYSPAKTVADCFKFRNKIGLTVAVEALKNALDSKKASVHEILKYAKLCRVDRVIQPYLEAFVHG